MGKSREGEFFRQEQILSKLLMKLTPISLDQFCSRWIPRLYGLSLETQEYDFRQACVHLISIIFKHRSKKTIQNWFSYPDTIPYDALRFLKAVDIIWSMMYEYDSELFTSSDFSENLVPPESED